MGKSIRSNTWAGTAQAVVFALLGIVGGLTSSCSLSSSDRDPSLSVDLSGLRGLGSSVPYALYDQGSSWGLFATTYSGPPSSLSGFTCFGVNVTGPGISDSSYRPNSNPMEDFERAVSEPGRYCNYRGVVTPPMYLSGSGTSEATLSIPPGDVRLVQVVGITSKEICDSGVIGQGGSVRGYPSYFEIGRTVLKQVYSDRSVNVLAHWPSESGTTGDLARMSRSMECEDGDGANGGSHHVIATQLALGSDFSCALSNQGEVWCWGQGNQGQLGNSMMGSSGVHRPARVVTQSGSEYVNLSGIVEIAAGEVHACARKNDGSVYCWGANSDGRLGDGTTTSRAYAVRVSGSESWSGTSQIAAGGNHTCAIKSGSVHCWGSNDSGQLGDNTILQKLVPTAVKNSSGSGSLTKVTQISLGTTHSCALINDGITPSTVQCWGNNTSNQLGRGGDSNNGLVPGNVVFLSDVRQIETGSTHTCAVMNGSGEVKCWGNGANGRLGSGTTATSGEPLSVVKGETDPLSLVGALSVQSGGNFSCAISPASEVFCWGRGSEGQLGVSTLGGPSHPKAVDSTLLGGLAGIQLGASHGCGINSSGQVQCWGDNTYGQAILENAPNLIGQPSTVHFY
jgi:alpha-tubulin suppressor-like RCC1 family protein